MIEPSIAARRLLRACALNGYRASLESPVLVDAIDIDTLTTEQWDGLSCGFCGHRGGAMTPLTHDPRALFIHVDESSCDA